MTEPRSLGEIWTEAEGDGHTFVIRAATGAVFRIGPFPAKRLVGRAVVN